MISRMIFPTHFVVVVVVVCFFLLVFLPGQTEFSFKSKDGHGDAKDRHGEATREKKWCTYAGKYIRGPRIQHFERSHLF